MFKRKQRPEPELMPLIKTFDEGWEWLKKNGWDVSMFDRLPHEGGVSLIAKRGNEYEIKVKAEGEIPLEAIRRLLDKIAENQLF